MTTPTAESILTWIGVATGGATLLFGCWRYLLQPLGRFLKNLRNHSVELSHALPGLLDLSRDARSSGISFEQAFRDQEEKTVWNERRLRLIFLAHGIAVFETDARGHWVWASPAWCRMTGLTVEQAARNGWVSAIHEDWRKIVRDEWENAVGDEREYNQCYQLNNRSSVHVYAMPVVIHSKLLGYIGIASPVKDCPE